MAHVRFFVNKSRSPYKCQSLFTITYCMYNVQCILYFECFTDNWQISLRKLYKNWGCEQGFLPSFIIFILKGTQDWKFFWLRFWNLYYFFVSYVKILRFYRKMFLFVPLWEELRFFRVVLGLRRMEKNVEGGPKNVLGFFH